jgi:tetratricopeptide (TPR) repeat protein
MKKHVQLITIVSFLIFLITLNDQAKAQNLPTPRPVSPAAFVSQTIGFTEISVNYSRANLILRGVDRSGNIWGKQIPYGFNKTNFGAQGDIPWRAGANENTIISFSDDVKIEGKDLAAGDYGLHMAVYEDGKVSLIFSTNTSSWGSFFYNEEEDALRVDVKLKDHPKTQVLSYDFIDFGRDYTVLALAWDDKIIPFKIEVDVDAVVIEEYTELLRGQAGFGWQPYITAANYCMQNNTHIDQGLAWIETSISRNQNFQNLSVKAGLLELEGKNDEAEKVYAEIVPIATMVELNALGYQMIGQKNFAKAIEYFELNVKNNPKDANCYDSLGEAYMLSGDTKNAIKNLKKSLSLDPPANVKANSLRLLGELGVEVDS